MHGPTGDSLGFFPAGTCGEAQESDRVRVVVRAGLALLEELGNLIQGEESQFDLIGLDLPDASQRFAVCNDTPGNPLRVPVRNHSADAVR